MDEADYSGLKANIEIICDRMLVLTEGLATSCDILLADRTETLSEKQKEYLAKIKDIASRSTDVNGMSCSIIDYIQDCQLVLSKTYTISDILLCCNTLYHELRTPTTIIQVSIDTLLRYHAKMGNPFAPQQQEYFQNIQSDFQLMLGLYYDFIGVYHELIMKCDGISSV